MHMEFALNMVGVQTHKDPLFAQTVLAGLEWAALLF